MPHWLMKLKLPWPWKIVKVQDPFLLDPRLQRVHLVLPRAVLAVSSGEKYLSPVVVWADLWVAQLEVPLPLLGEWVELNWHLPSPKRQCSDPGWDAQ